MFYTLVSIIIIHVGIVIICTTLYVICGRFKMGRYALVDIQLVVLNYVCKHGDCITFLPSLALEMTAGFKLAKIFGQCHRYKRCKETILQK